MMAFTCEKCGRRYTPTVEEIQAYLVASQGKKHALVPCPHCGKGSKVSPERLKQAVRFSTPAPADSSNPSDA